MYTVWTPSSAEGSDQRSPPAYVPYPRYLPPVPARFRPPPPNYCFDAARFASDTSKPRYLDVEREKLVTRWLTEANEALLGRREKPPKYKKDSRREFHDNFNINKRVSADTDSDDREFITLREFVDKYSLPRVVRLDRDDRPILLYRVLEAHRRVEAVQINGKSEKVIGKPLLIPESYDGWFSTCGCKGSVLAQPKNNLAALVRAGAFALVSPQALPAYRPVNESVNITTSNHFERAAARAGTPLKLSGVYNDGNKPRAPKYAQLIDPQGNKLYVPLKTKGELYEVCPEELGPLECCTDVTSTPQPVDNLSPGVRARVHRLPHLLNICRLPVRVKLVTGSVPIELANDVGKDILLRVAVTEPVLVMCTLPEYGSTPSSPTKMMSDLRHIHIRETLKLLPLSSSVKVRRTQLGYESEKRMFLSSRLHKALIFCQFNVDNWIRQISYADVTMEDKIKEDIVKEESTSPVRFEKQKKFTIQGIKLDTNKFFNKNERAQREVPDENEGSIIFLGKNELENMNYDVYSDDEAKDEIKSDLEKSKTSDTHNEEMQVFREDCSHQKKQRWFKNIRLVKASDDEKSDNYIERYKDFRDPFDPFGDKHSSMERYQDMAKLIEDRFGGGLRKEATNEKYHSYKSLTSSSDMGLSSSSNSNKKPILTKSVSVQTGVPDDSGYDDKEPSGNLKNRKNLSVDHINYCGSMESTSSSNRLLKSLDDSLLKKSVSKSSTNLERRQRIQPDLIPEKGIAKSESYSKFQSCEDMKGYRIGSLPSDRDYEPHLMQNSFITDKLCSEFHVKTKKILSKSTSNLLHPKRSLEVKNETNNSNSMPIKTERMVNVDSFSKINIIKKKIDKPRAPTPEEEPDEFDDDKSQVKLKRSISSIQKRKLPVIEDLPYGQVADAVANEFKQNSDNDSDNIYAEICTPSNSKSDYDTNDVLANDPVIYNVKKEIRVREKMKAINDDAFRHIEVVVIENNINFEEDETSISSNDSINGNDYRNEIAVDSLERDKKKDVVNHTVRLEITSCKDDFDLNNEVRCVDSSDNLAAKISSLNFSRSVAFIEHSEAIYDTLK